MRPQLGAAAAAAVLGAWPWAAQAARTVSPLRSFGKEASKKDVYWDVTYGPCDSTCGLGMQYPVQKRCRAWQDISILGHRGSPGLSVEVDQQACRALVEPAPERCFGYGACEWRVGAPPRDDCGFAEATCWSPEKGHAVNKSFCKSKESVLQDEDLWRSHNALVDTGCAALGAKPLQDICIMSVNYDKGFGVSGKVVAEKEPGPTFSHCAGADIVVLSTQELINTVWDYFKQYVKDTEEAATGYTLVQSCGKSISAAVAVFVKEGKRRFLAPAPNECTSLPDDDGSRGNTKGSEVGSIRSVLGTIAFASTHGARGGSIEPKRVQEVADAASALMVKHPSIVAWGGDINTRTVGLSGNEALQSAGTTHPDESQAAMDQNWQLRGGFDPRETLKILAATPDILGQEGETLDQVLQVASGSKIVQAPGIRDLCPSYRKVPSRGSVREASIKGTGFKIGGFNLWGTHEKETRWRPSLACEAGYGEEYYNSELDGAAYEGKKNRAPSWADRIMVSTSLDCQAVQKILVPEDHDSLFVKCTIKQP